MKLMLPRDFGGCGDFKCLGEMRIWGTSDTSGRMAFQAGGPISAISIEKVETAKLTC